LLYAVLDRPESSAYTLPTGEEVRPHPAFRVVATSNAAPDTLPEAIRSRFAIQIEAATVNPDAITDKPEGLQMDTRRWRAVCDLTPMFGLEGALALVVGDKEAAAIMQAIRISEAGKKV
jgi:hypothetical protein